MRSGALVCESEVIFAHPEKLNAYVVFDEKTDQEEIKISGRGKLFADKAQKS